MKQLKNVLWMFNLTIIFISFIGILYTILFYEAPVTTLLDPSAPIAASNLTFALFVVVILQLIATFYLYKTNTESRTTIRQLLFNIFLTLPSIIYGYALLVGTLDNSFPNIEISYLGIWSAYVTSFSTSMPTLIVVNLLLYLFAYLSVTMVKRERNYTQDN